MDDIDEYARKLAERTRARGRNLRHKTAEPAPSKRSLTADDLNCRCDGDTEKKVSPPKRQCLGDDKENGDAESKRVGTLRSLKQSPSALASKCTDDAEWVAVPRHVLVGDDNAAPRGLAVLRRKHDTSPNFSSKERQQAFSQAAALDEQKRAPRGLAALRRRQEVLLDADMAPSSTCGPKSSTLAKIDKSKQPPSCKDLEVNGLHASSQKNNWDPKVIASLEAQGFMKSPSASKLSYAFKPNAYCEAPGNSDCPAEVETNEGSSTVSASPPLPPPLPSAITVVSTKKTSEKANVPNVTVIHQKPPNNPRQGGVPQKSQAQQLGRDPSELSLQQRRALFEAAVVAEQAEQPCEAPENLSVAQRKALFEQQMKLSKAAAERSYPVVKQSKPLEKHVCNQAKTSAAPSHCEATLEEPERHCRVAEARARLEAMTQQKERELTPEFQSFKIVTLQSSVSNNAGLGQSPLCTTGSISSITHAQCSTMVPSTVKRVETSESDTSEECEYKPRVDSVSENSSDLSTSSESPITVQPATLNSANEVEGMDESGLGESWEQTLEEAEGAAGKMPNTPCDVAAYDMHHAQVKALEEEIVREKALMMENTVESREEFSNHHFEGLKNDASPEKEHVMGALKKEVSKNRLYPELPPMDWNNVPTVTPPPKPSRAPLPPEEDQLLVHTQSVYRRKVCTPIRQAGQPAKPCQMQFPSPAQSTNQLDIQAQIKALSREAEGQSVVMAQASRALDVCHSTMQFLGSAEQVEGERLLLLATERRQACLAEVERLKTRGGCGDDEVVQERACLTLSQLQLPLKREFLAAQLEGILGEDVHYFLCLVKHGAQVLASQMLSTTDNAGTNALCFSNHMTLRDLRADFAVQVQIYALQTKKETLSHHRKYRIGGKDGKHKLTPKSSSKGSVSKSTLSPATVCAPSGSKVRTPSFGLVGSVRFTVGNCRRSTFNLEKVPPNSPLEGTLLVQLMLRPEHHHELRGFLSMFEEVGGFGAWHRRWCVLAENRLSYWRYPEDEGSKEPVGRLELSQCTSPEARLASRDICARPHTIVLHINGKDHLLSADTREERQNWCSGLTSVLKSLRTWAGMGNN
ncbi:uncharacterized protein [Dermacentor andersoni]|uniref:uncharacterized protein isoform X1 n=1 Tax=Dermacentor andersoni TaxID=34620 RepID=UPI003B3A12A5